MKKICLFVVVSSLAAVLPAAAKDSLSINGNFTRVNTGTAASNSPGANFDMAIGNNKARVTITATNLAVGTNYQLIVGTVTNSFAGNVRRKANLFFQTFDGKYARPLNFDPRDQTVIISDGVSNILTLSLVLTNETAPLKYQESVNLTPPILTRPSLSRAGAAATAEAAFAETKTGLRNFRVTLKDVAAGTYEVFVDGVLRGSIEVANGTKGTILFESPAGNNDLRLDFDPRPKLIQVKVEGVVIFTGTLKVPLPGLP